MGTDVCITSIFRTPEEHKALYAATPEAQRPATSPHMRWEAADIRSTDFDSNEITRMLAFLNTWSGINGKPAAIYHTIIAGAPHFHVSYR